MTAPIVQWIEQSLSIDPSGSRHLLSAPDGFLKLLGTGAGQQLDFGNLNTTGSGAISDTKLVYARVSNLNGASGVYNMKFFLTSTSAFNNGTSRFLEMKSLHFQPNLRLNSSADNTPTTFPSQQNLFATTSFPTFQDNLQPWMNGIVDDDVSMYIYLALECDQNVDLGIKGGAGAGTFRFRLLYDFS